MRTWVVVLALSSSLTACKSKKGGGPGSPPPAVTSPAKSSLVAPKVEVATVLAKDERHPPFLFIIEDAGVKIGAAATWADLDANKLAISKKALPFDALDSMDKFTREQVALGMLGDAAVASIADWNESSHPVLDLDTLEEPALAQDDPPPPEDEHIGDESGGTGTAMALEEGKMGKLDSERAEGQYKMKKNAGDPQLAREQAIEQARNAGILANPGTGGFASLGGLGYLASEDGTPVRVAHVTGSILEESHGERPLRAMVLVAPTSNALKLVEVLQQTGAAIAVVHEGKIRPLRLSFTARDGAYDGSPTWFEARVSKAHIVVEAVPDKPIEITEVKELAAALGEARKIRGADANAPVDVLLDPDIDAQKLVDMLVALDVAGVRSIGMGPMPPAEELARRGHRIPTTSVGQPATQGELDKGTIRRVVRANLAKITACYTQALLATPDLGGTVIVQFVIEPTGKVANVTATGVDPAVATCVGDTVKTLLFPKPGGRGSVQVDYPFTFRP